MGLPQMVKIFWNALECCLTIPALVRSQWANLIMVVFFLERNFIAALTTYFHLFHLPSKIMINLVFKR